MKNVKLILIVCLGLVAFQSIVALPLPRHIMSHIAKSWERTQRVLVSRLASQESHEPLKKRANKWPFIGVATGAAILLSDDELEKLKKYDLDNAEEYENIMALANLEKMQDLRLRRVLFDKTISRTKSRTNEEYEKFCELVVKLVNNTDVAQEPMAFLSWLSHFTYQDRVKESIQKNRIFGKAIRAAALQNKADITDLLAEGSTIRSLGSLPLSGEDLAHMFLYCPRWYSRIDPRHYQVLMSVKEALFDDGKAMPMLLQFVDDAIVHQRADFVQHLFSFSWPGSSGWWWQKGFSIDLLSDETIRELQDFYFKNIDSLANLFSKLFHPNNKQLNDELIKKGQDFCVQRMQEKDFGALANINALQFHAGGQKTNIFNHNFAERLINAGELDGLEFLMKKISIPVDWEKLSPFALEQFSSFVINSMHKKGAAIFFAGLSEIRDAENRESYMNVLLCSPARAVVLDSLDDLESLMKKVSISVDWKSLNPADLEQLSSSVINSRYKKGAAAFFAGLSEIMDTGNRESYINTILHSPARSVVLDSLVTYRNDIDKEVMLCLLTKKKSWFLIPYTGLSPLFHALIDHIVTSNNVDAFESVLSLTFASITGDHIDVLESFFASTEGLQRWVTFWIEHRDRMLKALNDQSKYGYYMPHHHSVYNARFLSQLIEFLVASEDIDSLKWLAHNINMESFPYYTLSDGALATFDKNWPKLPSIFQERLNTHQPWKEYQAFKKITKIIANNEVDYLLSNETYITIENYQLCKSFDAWAASYVKQLSHEQIKALCIAISKSLKLEESQVIKSTVEQILATNDVRLLETVFFASETLFTNYLRKNKDQRIKIVDFCRAQQKISNSDRALKAVVNYIGTL